MATAVAATKHPLANPILWLEPTLALIIALVFVVILIGQNNYSGHEQELVAGTVLTGAFGSVALAFTRAWTILRWIPGVALYVLSVKWLIDLGATIHWHLSPLG